MSTIEKSADADSVEDIMWAEVFYFLAILAVVITISMLWTDMVGAVWLPTPMKVVHSMLRLAQVGPDDTVFDLGCGDGRMVITAARSFGAKAVGIEIDPLRYVLSQIMVTLWGVRDRVTIVYGNFFFQDLSTATVVTCYLRQKTNNRLEEKLMQELRPGTRVVSNTFIFPTVPAVGGNASARLYLFYPDKDQGLKEVIRE